MRLQFRGDEASEILTHILRRTIQNSFKAVELRLVFTTHPMMTLKLKDELPRITNSFRIYQFNCHCGTIYIGRSSRSLHFRARKHFPERINKGLLKKTNI
ncbi:unnamed protein product [Schistosoma rodhaini]|uniref:GIY-YIG domain-containing protein n=1 Tax=Schistosoma rodhaini TaxID=6188 RepID=A0AA85G982_9TREM|nr:unnamed protein product [Schistosoma rodhaini]